MFYYYQMFIGYVSPSVMGNKNSFTDTKTCIFWKNLEKIYKCRNTLNKKENMTTAEKIINQAHDYAVQGQYEKALELLEPLTKSEKVNERLEAKHELAYTYFLQGKYKLAEEKLRKILDEAKKHNLLHLVGRCYQSLSAICGVNGRVVDAIKLAREGVKMFKEAGDLYEELRAMNNIGAVYYDLEFYDEALLYYSQSLAIAQSLNNKRAMAHLNANVTLCYLKVLQLEDAEPYLKEAYELFTELNEKAMIGRCYELWGEFHYKSRNFDEAKKYFDKSVEIAERNKDPNALWSVYEQMGMMYGKMGDLEKKKEHIMKALVYAKELKNERIVKKLEKMLVEAEFIMTGKPIL